MVLALVFLGLLFTMGWLSEKALEQKIVWAVFFPVPVWIGMADVYQEKRRDPAVMMNGSRVLSF